MASGTSYSAQAAREQGIIGRVRKAEARSRGFRGAMEGERVIAGVQGTRTMNCVPEGAPSSRQRDLKIDEDTGRVTEVITGERRGCQDAAGEGQIV